LQLGCPAPELLKRLVYGREGPAMTVLDPSDCAALPWAEQAGEQQGCHKKWQDCFPAKPAGGTSGQHLGKLPGIGCGFPVLTRHRKMRQHVQINEMEREFRDRAKNSTKTDFLT
jgi:hypothetical protein